jgi:glycosyltransferase involved in cell wall biosynthesis
MDFIALIPAFDEVEHIQAVVTAAGTYLPVLVVDDGSHDGTAEIAEAAGATVVHQYPNQGKGAALRAGLRYARDAGCLAVVTLDADGQHDPLEIPKFIEAYRAGQPDLVIGARRFSQMPLVRRLANTLGGWILRLAAGRPIPDNQSGYRLIGSRLFDELIASQETGFEFEVEMIAICLKRGYRLEWAPIRTIYAGEKSHIQPWMHTVNYLRSVWRFYRRMRG